MFKQDPPKNMRTPLEKNDHPELDDTELRTVESIYHYLTMIGQLQLIVTLGRFDMHAQVTTMSRCSKEKASRKTKNDLWLCPEDKALLNQVQNQGTRLQVSSQHET